MLQQNRTVREFFNYLTSFGFEKQPNTQISTPDRLMEAWEYQAFPRSITLVIPKSPFPEETYKYKKWILMAHENTYCNEKMYTIGNPPASHLKVTT